MKCVIFLDLCWLFFMTHSETTTENWKVQSYPVMQPSIRPLPTCSVALYLCLPRRLKSLLKGPFVVWVGAPACRNVTDQPLSVLHSILCVLCWSRELIIPHQRISQAAVQLSSAFRPGWVGVWFLRSELALGRSRSRLWEHADLFMRQVFCLFVCFFLFCVLLIKISIWTCDRFNPDPSENLSHCHLTESFFQKQHDQKEHTWFSGMTFIQKGIKSSVLLTHNITFAGCTINSASSAALIHQQMVNKPADTEIFRSKDLLAALTQRSSCQ